MKPLKRFSPSVWLRRVQSPVVGFLWSLAFLAVMFWLRWGLTPTLGKQFPFFAFTLGVIFTSLFVGWQPAVLVLVVGYFLGEYFFLGGSLIPNDTTSILGAFIYCLTNGVIIAFAEAAHRGIAQATQAADALQQRNIEMEQLNIRLKRSIRETHHRVKNNLQVVAALTDIPLEIGVKSVPADDLRRIGQHVRTLAGIHDILTQNVNENAELESISTREVLDKLIPLIRSTLVNRTVEYTADSVELPIHHGSSLALLVSELISNSIKHGAGSIQIALTRKPVKPETPERLVLTVEDQGEGFPAEFDPLEAANTGLDLIDSLARYDLQGTLTFANSSMGGACVTVEFPLPTLPPATAAESTEQTDD